MRLAGRYELIERLAEGGMAEVWLATAHGDAGFTRRVAIKQLFPRQYDAGFERMFLDEARLTSRLHHQGIVSIVDFGIEGGRPFQVLELVDGADAWRLWKAGASQGTPLPPALALHICAQVAHALHFAHCAKDDAGAPLNIVHRDVSPQNVLLSRAGDVKLSDFGVAFAEGRLEKTVGGIARGKPAYMAPEQAVRGPMDGRTDVFALGCVLHALFTGQSALRDENALVDLLAGVTLPLEVTLPADVREVIARAVQRDKHARYESAEAFALACAALVPKYSISEPRTELANWVRSVVPEPVAKTAPPAPGTGLASGARSLGPDLRVGESAGARGVGPEPVATELTSGAHSVGPELASREHSLGPEPAAKTAPPATRTELTSGVRSVGPEPAAKTPPPAPPRARRWLFAASALGVAVVVLVGLSQRGTDTSDAGEVRRVEPSPTIEVSPPLEAPAPKRVEPTAPLETAPAPAPAPAPSARPKPQTTPAPPRFGVLAVGGERLLRGEVRLDGRLLGVAPARFDVELGPHQLEVTLPSGERIGPRAVSVGAQHTALSPLFVLE